MWQQTESYPDPSIEVIDPRFNQYRVSNTAIERLATGIRYGEGPVWFGDGRYLIWSDIPNNRLMRWDEETGGLSTFRHNSNYINGNTRDRQGRLISCEHGGRRVMRTEHDGRQTILVDNINGKRLNSPNDVVVASDDSIWFTDPLFGINGNYGGYQSKAELPTQVYRYDPHTQQTTVVVTDMKNPNGLCFSPDEKKLYIVESSSKPRCIRVYDVENLKRLKNGRILVDAGDAVPDGIRCDADGNIWAGWGGSPDKNGVMIFAPDGICIGRIALPDRCANLCFGGERHNRLFMVTGQSLFAVYVETCAAVPT